MELSDFVKEKVLDEIDKLNNFEKSVLNMVKMDLMYDRFWCKTHGVDYVHADQYQDLVGIYAYLCLYEKESV
jgi:hypothetical protein|tara:strand:+ start:303 stop:518 length:216 start_codon:yes stop_codon:yes gene_type:complete